jgi:hypothetical protein
MREVKITAAVQALSWTSGLPGWPGPLGRSSDIIVSELVASSSVPSVQALGAGGSKQRREEEEEKSLDVILASPTLAR